MKRQASHLAGALVLAALAFTCTAQADTDSADGTAGVRSVRLAINRSGAGVGTRSGAPRLSSQTPEQIREFLKERRIRRENMLAFEKERRERRENMLAFEKARQIRRENMHHWEVTHPQLAAAKALAKAQAANNGGGGSLTISGGGGVTVLGGATLNMGVGALNMGVGADTISFAKAGSLALNPITSFNAAGANLTATTIRTNTTTGGTLTLNSSSNTLGLNTIPTAAGSVSVATNATVNWGAAGSISLIRGGTFTSGGVVTVNSAGLTTLTGSTNTATGLTTSGTLTLNAQEAGDEDLLEQFNDFSDEP